MSGLGFVTLGLLVLLSIPVVVSDLKERRIPNAWNLALAATGLVVALLRTPSWGTLGAAAFGCGCTLALFLGLVVLMRLLKRPTALGMGDVKFLAAASLWVGFTGAVIIFIFASILALAVALALAPWQGLDLKAPRPFGPMLAASLISLVGLLEWHRPGA